jgi:ABC-2 type transport system ATP-binding protein
VSEAVLGSTAHVAERARPRRTGPAALAVTAVSKRWPAQPAPVLDRVSVRVERGTTTAIVGRNGAGKTTLLRVAAGLIAADSGRVEVGGFDVERDRAAFQRQVGLLSAGNSGLYARLKVEHHLDMWTRLALMPRRERRDAIDEAIELFDLGPLCGRRVDRLSMGQRQRLRLALCFAHRPSLALLDEPATSLDEDGVALVANALATLRARGGAAVVCIPTGSQQAIPVDTTLALESGVLEEAP